MKMSSTAEACLHSTPSERTKPLRSISEDHGDTSSQGPHRTQNPTPTECAASTTKKDRQDIRLAKEFEQARAEVDSTVAPREVAYRDRDGPAEVSRPAEVPRTKSSIFRLQTKSGDVYERQYAFAVFVGILLSFNAGYVNGSCLTGLIGQTARTVNVTSHTGTITLAALRLAMGDFSEFGFLTSMTLCFLLGGFVAAWLTPHPRAFVIEPSYGPTFLLGAACLTVSSLIAAFDKNERFIYYLASAANGIQNGVSSLYSHNLIRTTGFTGTTTDIGIFFGQFLRGNRTNTWKLIVNSSVCFSFWLGGLVSLYATNAFIQYSLLVNAILFFLIGGGVVAFLILELDISFGAAVFGAWQWRRALTQLETLVHDPGSSMFQDMDESLSNHHHIDALFDKFDTDKSGAIDKNELHAALRHAGIIISKRQTAQMMKRADKNGDGEIDKDEWREIVNACSSHAGKDGMGNSVRNNNSTREDSSKRRIAEPFETMKNPIVPNEGESKVCNLRGDPGESSEEVKVPERSDEVKNGEAKRRLSLKEEQDGPPEKVNMTEPDSSGSEQPSSKRRDASAATAPSTSIQPNAANSSVSTDYET